ncbi:serine/threonine-protein kinase [Streptomyces ovatisporus]|uniref:non-specific serine/threonine protein kinase n=1 Tax=Streptomyces ovatisporus TaxID=1128682 RepID=A0ABV9ABN0_9ACTN
MTDQDRLLAGRYRLDRELGRGGMGTVWLAEDALLDRRVAVKKLHVPPQLDDDERTRLYERTRREARSAARISHPGVIVVHDVVEENGLPCIIMEYVPSRSLSELLRENGPLAPEEAARTGLAMASALRAAHAAGVLHRDVKPANVLVQEGSERIVLTDFGIAAASGTDTLTRTGEFVGSIDYASPERMLGRDAGPSADAWALGATLYEAVEGVPPFRRGSWVETACAASGEPPRAMERAGELGELIEGLLHKDAGERLTLDQAEVWLRGASGTVRLPAPREAPPAGPEHTDQQQTQIQPQPRDAGPEEPAPRPQAQAPSDSGSGQARSAGRPGRGARTVAWALCSALAAAAIAGGAWWMARDAGGDGPGSPGPSASHSGPSQSAPPPRPPVAEGYERVEDELGFSVDVPEGWKRRGQPGGQQVDYVAPSGLTGLKFSVVDFAGDSPLRHWRQLEPEVREKSPGYTRLRMNATTYQGRDAAIWEYKWQGRARPYRAVDLGFGSEGKAHYALYLSAPEAQWDAAKPHFDMAVETFRVTPRD